MATDTFAGWIIGTAADCDMTVIDEYASKRHAAIVRDDDGQVWVWDLGSTNGTRVIHNGVTSKVPLGTRRPIWPGDTVIVGRTKIPWTEKP